MAPAPSDRDAPPMEPEGLLDAKEPDADFLGELGAPDAILQAVMKNLGAEADAMRFLDEVAREEEEAEREAVRRVRRMRAKLERRCDFLLRRLRLRQARAIGEHAAEELRAAFGSEVSSASSSAPARCLLKRLESSVAMPSTSASMTAMTAMTDVLSPSTGASAAPLRCRLRLAKRRLDSDATESSSGAESADEAAPYSNAHQTRLPIAKRAMWKWAQDRASIASRWTWLQAQIQELEYKIRQHAELQRKVRAAKGSDALCEPSGYTGPLPGRSGAPAEEESCIRMRPLNRTAFRKRKLLQMHNLHTAAEKAAKPSNIRCICQWPLGGCAVCTGRVLPMHPLPYASALTKRERLALVDPAFHPVLSSHKEISTSVQYSAKMKIPNWQQKCALKIYKGSPMGVNKPAMTSSKLIMPNKSHSKKKKHSKTKRGRPNAVAVDRINQIRRRTSVHDNIKKEGFDNVGSPQAPYPSGSSSPVLSPSDHRQRPRERMERSRLNSSFDIDNIVIPHSIAANTKLEILQYKEILTPKWRTVEPEEVQPSNNGLIRKSLPLVPEDKETDVEDISESTIIARHDRCEEQEKGKYLQKRKSSRRQNSRSGTGSNPPLTPSETPPHTPATIIDETSTHSESAISNPTSIVSTPLTIANIAPSSSNSATVMTSISESINTSTLQTHSSSSISHKRRLTLQMDEIEIIPPYSPRTFPLCDETYNKMLMMMPDNHPLSIGESTTQNPNEPCAIGSDSESNSALTYCVPVETVVEGPQALMGPPSDSDGDSCSAPPEEDPNDPEWNVAVHAD